MNTGKIISRAALCALLAGVPFWAQAAVSPAQAVAVAEQKTGATAVEIEYERERKAAYYEIQLRAPKNEYEVHIDAGDGGIIRQDSSREDDAVPPAGLIGLAKAVDSVLARYPGSTLDKAELDRERRGWVYKVRVEDGNGARISLRLDAQNGEILKR